MMSINRVLLCRPTYFNVTYVINPHMRLHSVNTTNALSQWNVLVGKLKSMNIEVEIIEQEADVPDMVFAKDQGIVKDGSVLLANFRYLQRHKEQQYYAQWFRANGFDVHELSGMSPFEGANTLAYADRLLVGINFRANEATCKELAQSLDVEVVALELVDPYFYQLNMCVLPINETTLFYYPAALSEDSVNLLNKLVPNLYELSEEAANAYAANSFVNDRSIIIPKGTPKSFKKDLDTLALTLHEVDISEFKKAGGGVQCLINVLA